MTITFTVATTMPVVKCTRGSAHGCVQDARDGCDDGHDVRGDGRDLDGDGRDLDGDGRDLPATTS
jgi:hypothetical protein